MDLHEELITYKRRTYFLGGVLTTLCIFGLVHGFSGPESYGVQLPAVESTRQLAELTSYHPEESELFVHAEETDGTVEDKATEVTLSEVEEADARELPGSLPTDVPYKLIKAGAECGSYDKWLGRYNTIQECADHARRDPMYQHNGRYFIYGASGRKAGKCYIEKTQGTISGNNCGTGLQGRLSDSYTFERDTYNFYKLLDHADVVPFFNAAGRNTLIRGCTQPNSLKGPDQKCWNNAVVSGDDSRMQCQILCSDRSDCNVFWAYDSGRCCLTSGCPNMNAHYDMSRYGGQMMQKASY